MHSNVGTPGQTGFRKTREFCGPMFPHSENPCSRSYGRDHPKISLDSETWLFTTSQILQRKLCFKWILVMAPVLSLKRLSGAYWHVQILPRFAGNRENCWEWRKLCQVGLVVAPMHSGPQVTLKIVCCLLKPFNQDKNIIWSCLPFLFPLSLKTFGAIRHFISIKTSLKNCTLYNNDCLKFFTIVTYWQSPLII